MLKQSTRERLQLLVQHPDFEGSVHIVDKKMFHSMNNGEPTFYVDVTIHSEGPEIFTLLAVQFPEMEVTNIRPYSTDLSERIIYGKMADGKIEGAEVNVWANYGETVKEKAPTAMGAGEEISQVNSTIDTLNIPPMVDQVWAKEILEESGANA